MKKSLTIALLISAMHAAHAQEFPLIKNAAQTAKDLKITCQKLKVAKNNCVIAHFKSQGDMNEPYNAEATKKPSDLYRVLIGTSDQNAYVIADYFKNGQVFSPLFTSDERTLLTTAWLWSDLNATTSKDHVLYSKDGRQVTRFTLVNGAYKGPYTNWYDNGQIREEGSYANEQLNGNHKSWNRDGSLESQGQYENGEKTGLWTTFYEASENKYSETTYKAGLPSGTSTTWYENGNIATQTNFNDRGELDGSSTTWYENGQKNTEANYTDDDSNGRSESWYENGQKLMSGQYKNNQPTGTFKYWDDSGKSTAEEQYKNGERIDAEGVAERARDQEYEAAAAIKQTEERLTQTLNANEAAQDLSNRCQVYKRKDQCVIVYFAQNYQYQTRSKNAKYYRVLHGKVGELYIIQDFHMNGNKQSDTVFARAEDGVSTGFNNADLAIHGNFQTYTPTGEVENSFHYLNGQDLDNNVDEYADVAARAKEAAVEAVQNAIDATKAAAAASE